MPGRSERRARASTVKLDDGRSISSLFMPSQRCQTRASPFRGVKNLKVGTSWTMTHFDPLTRKSQVTQINVNRREKLTYRGEAKNCFVLSAHPATGAGSYGPPMATAWVSPEGQLLREEVQVPPLFKLAFVLEDSMTAEERDFHKSTKPAAQKRAGGEKRR